MKKFALCLCLVLAVVACATGCGKEKRCLLSGTVSLDGQPLPVGVINFQPENPDPTKGVVGSSCDILDGAYAMNPKGALLLPGKYKVQVIATSAVHKKTGEIVDPDDVKDGKYDPTEIEHKDLVPPKYGYESQEFVEVGNSSKQTYDLDMKSE